VLLLGVTYKPDIADQRESPAVPVAQALMALGARVIFHDPMVEVWRLGSEQLTRVADLDTALAEADVSIVLQANRAYDLDHLALSARVLFDTRGASTADTTVRL